MRIGINIPDDLLKRLEPLKTVTNVSQICREAIAMHVEAYERALIQAKEDGMNEIAARLGNMIVPQEVDWELLGIEDAKMWVQLAKLGDFEYLLHRLDVLERQGRSPYQVPIPDVQGVKFFENHLSDYDEWFEKLIAADEQTDHYANAKFKYQRAKLSYILSVWNMAREVANERFKQESLTREKAKREAKSKVEMPEKLINELK